MAFFKDSFSKLVDAVNQVKGPKTEGYRGQLCAEKLELVDEGLLGLGAVPETLTSSSSAVAFATNAGHVRVIAQDLDVTLRNPAAPVQPQLLLLPRPGLVLLIGVSARVACSENDPPKSTWIAQWWDLADASPVAQAAQAPPAAAELRFAVRACDVCVAEQLVFLGTEEGDVRVFDVGERVHLASYCVPGLSAFRAAQPSPVCALAAEGSAELLVANGAGGLLLWSFEKHRVVRSFDSTSPITSILWCPKGTHFVAASQHDLGLFARGSSSALARFTWPTRGDAAGLAGARLLHWEESEAPAPATSSTFGHLYLRAAQRGPLQRWSGDNWTVVDTLLPDVLAATRGPATLANLGALGGSSELSCEGPVFLALQPNRLMAVQRKSWPITWQSLPLVDVTSLELLPSSSLASPPKPAPSPVPAEPVPGSESGRRWAVKDGELQEGVTCSPEGEVPSDDGWFICSGPEQPEEPEALQWQLEVDAGEVHGEISFGLDAKVELRLGELVLRFDLAEQGLAWENNDQSPRSEHVELDLAPGTSHTVKAHFEELGTENGLFSLEVDEVPLPLPCPRSPLEVLEWRCREGELRVRHLYADPLEPEPDRALEPETALAEPMDAVATPVEWVQQMWALHQVHLQSFLQGTHEATGPPAELAAELSLEDAEGLWASGHGDGTLRIWLRRRSSLVLLHVLSVSPPATPYAWRPRYDVATAAPATSSGDVVDQLVYDGIDAAPAFATTSDDLVGGISAVALAPMAAAVAAGTGGGEVLCFLWRPSWSKLTNSEAAEWRVQSLLAKSESDDGSADCPAPTDLHTYGFVCAMRLRQHQVGINHLKLLADGSSAPRLLLCSSDAAGVLCITDGLNGQMLFASSFAIGNRSSGPAPPPETVEAVDFSSCILQAATASATGREHEAVRLSPTPPNDPNGPPGQSTGAVLVALSSGQLRQLAAHAAEFRLLDSRIRETRLPQLLGGCGRVLLLKLTEATEVFGSLMLCRQAVFIR
ncbi:Proteasome subunit alpha type-4-A [Durusdinium trenchii]|uniref:Proteasome subunit alpha type-4-A n=1 Tax=Durusdinium trenchii TaxID=1381693 RepID=A0ABP0PV36_9DINO